MDIVYQEITLKVSEREARLIGFAIHEYIWAKAKQFVSQHPDGTWDGFLRLNSPSDLESNDMFEMWSKLACFWKQESIKDFENLIKKEVFKKKE